MFRVDRRWDRDMYWKGLEYLTAEAVSPASRLHAKIGGTGTILQYHVLPCLNDSVANVNCARRSRPVFPRFSIPILPHGRSALYPFQPGRLLAREPTQIADSGRQHVLIYFVEDDMDPTPRSEQTGGRAGGILHVCVFSSRREVGDNYERKKSSLCTARNIDQVVNASV